MVVASYLHVYFRVIDGADSTLDAIEKTPIDAKNRPLQEIRIKSITIHANPIADKQA
jgi:peptidyl-prolyl cis-trans isomerase-like 3